MTPNTTTNDLHSKSTSIATTLTKTVLAMMLIMNVGLIGGVSAAEDSTDSPTDDELCSNALTDIIDRVMFFLFNLFPIITFTAFVGAYVMEKISGAKKKGEYRDWRNRAGWGTIGLVVLGQMGGWFLGTFLNVSPACLDNFTNMTLLAPTVNLATQTLTMVPV